MVASLTADQLRAITVIERVGSVFSLLGCIFILVTFSISKAFHKPINRLVFYASFGNMMTNVATLIAREYLESINSVGCQFQAFLIQMFMPADAFWTLAMAVNVYLTFYFKYDAERLRRMEVWYFVCCYGIPFVPALTYIFITKSSARMYGNATLWCWVSSEWDIFRIATFYGPVWVAILITFFIYLRAGGEIYRRRKQLRYFSSSHDPEPLTVDDPYSTKTTEVTVTSEEASQQDQGIGLSTLDKDGVPNEPARSGNGPAYSVTITSSIRNNRDSQILSAAPNVKHATILEPPTTARGRGQRRRNNYEANNAAWSYTKCAILFFTAILITWLPSSANRVYSVVHTGEISVPLEFMSALVLPLQGFWNAVVYVTTSWSACKYFFSELVHQTRMSDVKKHSAGGSDRRNSNFKIPQLRTKNADDTESMTELANDSTPGYSESRRSST
ncbi:hypothetical protein BX600DRAFT_96104 [Xylariales sp. PMI_506]|nr:hypothetical protein BX600DRAFT_96104 [Xylariales sp. PMI_506]